MNKKFSEFFGNKGLNIEGNLAFGTLYGYEINYFIRMMDQKAPVLLHISTYASHEQKNQMVSELRNQKIKFLTPLFDDYGLILGLNDVTVGKLLSRLDEILKITINIIKEKGGQDNKYCPLCGKELDIEQSRKYNVDGFYLTLDSDCVSNMNQVIEKENEAIDAQPNNYFKGFLGAILGAGIGAASFVIIFLLEFISAISAYLAVFLGALFYQKFGGKRNKMMVLIVAVVSIFAICGTLVGLYIIAATGISVEQGTNLIGFKAFSEMMKDPSFSSEFYSNLALTFLFTALGCGQEIYNLSKSVKRTQKIK